MDVILCFFHWIPKGAMRSWRSLPRCSDRRAVRGGLRSSPCPSVFSSPPRRRGVPRRWWPVLSFCVCFHGSCVLFLFCSFSSWRHHEVTPPDAITRWHRLTPLRDDTAATSKNPYNLAAEPACSAPDSSGSHCGTSLMLSLSWLSIWLLLSYSIPFNSTF